MKATSLITALEDAVAKYGDKPVKILDLDGNLTAVDYVAYPDEGDAKGSFILCDKETMEVLG